MSRAYVGCYETSAARIVDPIIAGSNTGEHIWEKFLRDYKEPD